MSAARAQVPRAVAVGAPLVLDVVGLLAGGVAVVWLAGVAAAGGHVALEGALFAVTVGDGVGF